MNFLDHVAPMPTAPPTTLDLQRRSAKSEQITITIAPNNICGYISERPGASRACAVDDYCYFFPPVPSLSYEHGGVFCCGSTSCQFRATCINSKEYFQSSKCDGGCEVDNYTLKCTNSASPYCNTVSWSGNTLDYWCNDIEITTAQSAALTYKGQKSREFTTIDEDDYSSLVSQISEAKTASITGGLATQTSSPTATETNSDDSGSSSAPVGAIAGGAVGGVAALGLLGLAVFFFMRRKKKQNQTTSTSAYQQAPGDNSGGPENKVAWPAGQQPGAPYYYHPNTPSTMTSTVSPNSQYMYPQAAGYPAGFQPQQPAIHEAGGEAVESKPQELADTVHGRKEPVELA
ncbi:hypothetical protein ACHAPJ_011438 [Fusarium lateritium]